MWTELATMHLRFARTSRKFKTRADRAVLAASGEMRLHERTKVPRRYVHSTNVIGATAAADMRELRALVESAAFLGMTECDLEEELAKRTGFEGAVRSWFRRRETPNGLVRKVILNCAQQIVGTSSLHTSK